MDILKALEAKIGKVEFSKKYVKSPSKGEGQPISPRSKVLSCLKDCVKYLTKVRPDGTPVDLGSPIPKEGKKPVCAKIWNKDASGDYQFTPKMGNVNVFFTEDDCSNLTFIKVKGIAEMVTAMKGIIEVIEEGTTDDDFAVWANTTSYARDGENILKDESGRKVLLKSGKKDKDGKPIPEKTVRKVTFATQN